MATETIKSLREKAEELVESGVTNKEVLFEALPVVMELKTKAEFAKKNLAAAVKSLTMLEELCSKYALRHESVFEKSRLVTSQQNVRVGDIVLNETTYHFASGYDGYERIDEGKLTRDFLQSLPETWRKESLKLNVTGINEEKPSDEDLAGYGLRQKAKNVWSVEG